MSKIIIDINEIDSILILSGDIQSIISNRFSIRFIKDFFSPIFVENTIQIKYDEDDIESKIDNLKSMFEKHRFEFMFSQKIEERIQHYFDDERKFIEFSEQAFNIRNNQCDLEDFKNFTNIISNHLTNRTLYALQLLASYHLAFSQNACNFSVPGAGKTSIVYGAYTYLSTLSITNVKYVNKLLIVGPLSSFGPWENEYFECFGFKPNCSRIVSSMSKSERIDYFYKTKTSEITLISYASFTNLSNDIEFFLKNNKVMIVLDEAHKIKNVSGGKIASSVIRMSKFCKSRVVLTGTPAPNGYEDLYNIFKFIWPTRNILDYQINQLRDMSTNKSDSRVKKLINSIEPYFIRIKKSDLKIPNAKENKPIMVKMGKYQREIYDFLEKKYVNTILENHNNLTTQFKKDVIAAKLVRLMQVSTNPSLLLNTLNSTIENYGLENDININDSEIISNILNYKTNEIPEKFIAAEKLISEILNKGQKVIVWATFIQTILDFKEYLKSKNIVSQELYGAIPVESNEENENDYQNELTREKIVNSFHDSKCPFKVIIANPFAVSESISLHKACKNAIYLERTFNAAHFIQSKDRIHRYGLKENEVVNYYYIISEDSIDESIDERLKIKEKRMNEIIESMPIPLFDNIEDDLGDEDVKALMRNYADRTKKFT